MDLCDAVIISTSAIGMGIFLGTTIGQYSKAFENLKLDPFRAEEYEDVWKEKRFESIGGFISYFGGYFGRQFAYNHFDDPANWR